MTSVLGQLWREPLGDTLVMRQHTDEHSLWAVIRTSALRRLGKPLLLAYLGLALFGAAVVLGALLCMRL